MKRQLLLGTALLAAISAFPQASKVKAKYEPVDMAAKIAQKYSIINNANEGTPTGNPSAPIGPVMQANSERSSAAAPIIWQGLTGSMNIFGVLVSEQKPLHYNDNLNVVTFVHRKSPTYIPSPVASPSTAASGCIVMEVTTDWGNSWDSTLLWNNNTQFARYPQGGIYNPPGNTSIANTYGVVGGPITTGTGWIGSYLASKKLDVKGSLAYDNVASTAPNAQQFFANTAPFGATGKFDFPRLYFTSTDDGMVRMVGRINDNINGTTLVAQNYRGARILKGAFNSGVFTWTGDSIIPANIVVTGAGQKQIIPDAMHMAWNEAGTVGYMVFLGCDNTKTLSNRGLQPIVYKTTNSGATWSTVQGIDFNSPAMAAPVIDHIVSVNTNSTLVIPQFNTGEGVDVVVDKNDRLHIMASLLPTFSSHPDSLFFSYSFTNADGEKYNYRHIPGERPYIYDFYQTATGWSVTIVDSMSTEGPSPTSGGDGYNDNPWKADPSNSNSKQSCDARMQMSRTPDGNYIVYTWAESDTNFTNSNHKWNHLPNLKARVLDVTANTIHTLEINMTNPATQANPLVASRATMHYVSPKCGYVYSPTTTINGPILRLPATVSNDQNTPMEQVLPCKHWYTSATLEYGKLNDVSVKENAISSLQNSVIFPNPASNQANLLINLNNESKINIEIFNTIGQLVKTVSAQGHLGENTIVMDLKGLNTGVYMVTVKNNNASTTKKLIVE